MKNMKYTIIIVMLFILGVASRHFVRTDAAEDSDFALFTLREHDFSIEIKTIGTLDAARSHMISSQLQGDKGKIIYLVNDGEAVKSGDVLVRLDPAPFEEEILRLKGETVSLQSAVEAAEQILEWEKNQMEKELSTAQFNLKIARLEAKRLVEGEGPLQISQFREEKEKAAEEYNRYISYISDLRELNKKGYENPTELKMAEKKSLELKEKYASAEKKYISYTQHVFPSLKESANAKVGKAEMELEQIRKGSVFKIAKAISSVNETKGRLAIMTESLKHAQNELDRTGITAPFSGIAILYETFRDGQKRKPRVGDGVLKNQPILYLPDISAMIVETRIREIDLHKASRGQVCMIRADACPDIVFEGEVVFIGVMAEMQHERKSGEKYFQVTISLKKEDARLRPGMTARVAILADQVRNALSVPVQAVFEENGDMFCYQFTGRTFRKVKIQTGRQNENMTEILSGLKKGDQVSLLRPSPKDIL